MTVTSGADNAHRGGGLVYSLDRQNGSTYEYEWLQAILVNPENIIIGSWNGYGDGNAIEASHPATSAQATWTDTYGTEVPDWYEQITSAYGNLKIGLMAGGFYYDVNTGFKYKVENSQLVCQSSAPHGHPVIPLPTGLLAKLGAGDCEPFNFSFGGMYGFSGGGTSTILTYPNPATGGTSCPSGYTASQVFGTSNQDWPIYSCSRPHTANSTSVFQFGGMYGYGSDSSGAMTTYVNPFTNAMSCSNGYTASQVLGTNNLDWPAYFCYK